MSKNKHKKMQKYVSYDRGLNWEPVVPTVYEPGDLIEEDSPDCGAEVITWVPVDDEYICTEATNN